MFRFLIKWFLIVVVIVAFHSIPITYTFSIKEIAPKDIIYYKAIGTYIRYFVDSNDTVVLNINSPGGLSDVATEFVSALRASKGYVKTHVDNFAASAGSYIALNGMELSCTGDSIFLFHRAYYEVDGNAILAGRHINLEDYNNWLLGRVLPLLTKEEGEKLLLGTDIVISCETLINRMNNRVPNALDIEFDKPNDFVIIK